MRPNTILWTLFIAGITAQGTLAVSETRATEERSANDLFATMQAKLTGAKTVSVTVSANVKDAMSLKAGIKLAPGNKANLSIVTKRPEGNTVDRAYVISDGMKQVNSNPHQSKESVRPADPHLSANLIASLTHTGFLVPHLFIASQRKSTRAQQESVAKSPRVTDLFKVGTLELGEKAISDKRTTRAVSYRINADDPQSSITGTVWIDLKTQLPQKRTVTFMGISAEENYTNWKLDTSMEQATFSLTEKN